MKKADMKHSEKAETPAMEAKCHSKAFLKKSVAKASSKKMPKK